MKFNVAKIVGTVNQTTWSQVHVFLPEGEKLSSHGQLIAALSFAAKKEIEIASFGKEIIVRLQEIYYSNEAESRLKKVSQSMESLAAEFYNEVELNMALAVIVPLGEKKLVYAGRRGGGQVYLKRDEAVVGLLAAEENQQVVSGELKAFDKLVVGTSQFFKIVPESHLEMALKEDRAEAAVESLGALVHGREENSQAAAAVVMPIRQGFGGELSPTAQGKGVEPADVKSLSAVSRLTALASSAGQRFRGLIKQAVERVSKRGGAEVFVRPGASRGKKSTATVMIVLVVIFGLSLVLAGRKRQVRVREEKYQAVVEEVSYKVDEGEGLLELNPLRARSLLSEAQGLIDNYKSENEGEVSGELSDLEKRLGDLLAQAQREYAVESADEWFDFGLVKEGFKATAWASDEGKVLIWGEGERTVVELDLTSKSSEIVAGGDEVGSGNLIALTGERGMVVGKDKMVVVDVSGGEVAAEVA
ncbi:TPA: hypothetical protein DEB02_01755, partial [Candidatus Beckwithbacteria bacterium]|nr:hypothetical protein [Candidatus Beckwithbacteria bacterium]